jgi:hypothetical protein
MIMKLLLAIFLATLCAATGHGQTLKSLMYNTTNGQVMYSGTNVLTFTNTIRTDRIESATVGSDAFIYFDSDVIRMEATAVAFEGPMEFYFPIVFQGTNPASVAAATRTNLGLGATNTPAFRGLTSDGNIVITNQTATNNGILFVYRTNNEPFLGLANLIASNNTTISNETLFRVGTAEATNRSAQFGFRSTNTNGSGVAVFSVFGYNALMQIGADASTNAVIFSGGGTNNEVMTLIRDGATEFARPIRFSTNASTRPATNAPANATNVAAWVEFRIGTNSYRAPLYQ